MGVTFVSTLTVLGYPGHAYVYGTITFWFALSTIMQLLISWMYYIPMLHRLQLSSVYEVRNILNDLQSEKALQIS